MISGKTEIIRIERWFESYLEYLKFLGLNIKNDRPSVFEMIQKNSQYSQIFSFSLYSWVTIFSQWKKKQRKMIIYFKICQKCSRKKKQ